MHIADQLTRQFAERSADDRHRHAEESRRRNAIARASLNSALDVGCGKVRIRSHLVGARWMQRRSRTPGTLGHRLHDLT
jgi:hypothetical protein